MFSQQVPDVSNQNFYCKTMKGRKFEPSCISDRLSVSADTCYQLSVTAVIGEPFSVTTERSTVQSSTTTRSFSCTQVIHSSTFGENILYPVQMLPHSAH